MGQRDLVSEQNLRALLASVEAEGLAPPDSLTGEAREIFLTLVDSNKARPWNRSHVPLIADYCRLAVMWGEQFALIQSEGVMVGGKANPRFAATRAIATERLQLGRLLGITTRIKDRLLGGGDQTGARAREIGASLARVKDGDREGLLL